VTVGFDFYAVEPSHFSGKVRTYFRYKRIPFSEKGADRKTYIRTLIPHIGYPIIPVVVTPEGEWLQDSTDIIDALEARFPDAPIYPATPRQKLVALLMEIYGDEWLLLPAMHYRWNYNYDWIVGEFGRISMPQLPPPERHEAGLRIAKPYRNVLPTLGVTPATAAAIELSYEALLRELDLHFMSNEFLLGSKPSIGDFGLIGPLYAHLYRDPKSGEIMKKIAPEVARYVERMLRPPQPKGGEYLAGDTIPQSLMPVLMRMMREVLPVFVATAQFFTQWVAANATQSGEEIPRHIGTHEFTLEGVTETRAVAPYCLWMVQRVLDHMASLDGAAKDDASALLVEAGGAAFLSFPTFPRLARKNYRLVLA